MRTELCQTESVFRGLDSMWAGRLTEDTDSAI